MKRLALVLACSVIAGSASARSSMETAVVRDMERAGLSAECIAKLTTSDVTFITSANHDRNLSSGDRNSRISNRYRQICER